MISCFSEASLRDVSQYKLKFLQYISQMKKLIFKSFLYHFSKLQIVDQKFSLKSIKIIFVKFLEQVNGPVKFFIFNIFIYITLARASIL